MAPQTDSPYCWAHDPANAEAAAEARKLGGIRRRREGTVAGAFAFEGLTNVSQLRRLLEIAAFDALSLENSVARVRAIIALVLAGAKLLETGELEERIATLEAATHRHDDPHPSTFAFDAELDDSWPGENP
jgi:hypothetical protein